jgi:hypothetical protein
MRIERKRKRAAPAAACSGSSGTHAKRDDVDALCDVAARSRIAREETRNALIRERKAHNRHRRRDPLECETGLGENAEPRNVSRTRSGVSCRMLTRRE